MTKTGVVGIAAARAGMSRNTATKYLAAGKVPSEMAATRNWVTRENPFEQDWPWVEEKLELPTPWRSSPAARTQRVHCPLSRQRPHQSLGNNLIAPANDDPPNGNRVVVDERLGGLLRSYRRSA